MKGFGAWLLSILGIVVIGTLIDLLLPSGRMRNFLKSVFASITVLIIVLPIPGVIKNGFDFKKDFFNGSEFVLDESLLEATKRQKFAYMEKGFLEVAKSEGVTGLKVTIDGDFLSGQIKIKEVRINLTNVVIDKNLEHINKYTLLDGLVTKYLNVGKEVIVYE